VRVKKPVNNRRKGLNFEKTCKAHWKALGARICTPVDTALQIGKVRGIVLHRDFFKEGDQLDGLDGLGYVPGSFGLFGWQAKHDFLEWSANRRLVFETGMIRLARNLGVPVFVMFADKAAKDGLGVLPLGDEEALLRVFAWKTRGKPPASPEKPVTTPKTSVQPSEKVDYDAC
jgi:hypothetical protein